MTQQINAALARKLTAGQSGAGASRSVLRALRLALARAADECLSLPLTVIGAKQSTRAPGELNSVIDDDWLHLVFTSDQGSVAICLDPGCVSAIVQQQTIGGVMEDTPPPRSFTDTDAAMTVPLAEGLFRRVQKLLESPADLACFSGSEFASRMADIRSLALGLIDDSYQVFELTVEFAGGARQGQICLLLPEPTMRDDDGAIEVTDQGPRLDRAAGVIRAELHSVICRLSPSLADLSDLRVGDVLPLTGARLDRTEITTLDSVSVAMGQLGQCGGMRAVRINEHSAGPIAAAEIGQAFLESATTGSMGTSADITTAVDTEAEMPLSTEPSTKLEKEVVIGSSDQIVAEISQLAGLNTDPDRVP